MSAAAIAEARARLGAALTGYADRTGDPHPVSSGSGLPAFAVRLALSSGDRAAMGAGAFWREGVLTVSVWAEPADPLTAEAGAASLAAAVETALLAAPSDLAGTVWDIAPEGREASHDATERRVTAVEVAFAVRFLLGG